MDGRRSYRAVCDFVLTGGRYDRKHLGQAWMTRDSRDEYIMERACGVGNGGGVIDLQFFMDGQDLQDDGLDGGVRVGEDGIAAAGLR